MQLTKSLTFSRGFPKFCLWVDVVFSFFFGGEDEGMDLVSSGFSITQYVLGGSSQDLYVVNNHGDRCCPQDLGLWDPFPNGLNSMAYK